MKALDLKHQAETDVNLQRAKELGGKGLRAAPGAAAHYVLEKLPIIGWLPKYNPRWILNDVVAGLTLGVMLIPQGLSYAKIATIPVEFGLMSSWLPALVYTLMGTSKDISTGPTSLVGLLTADVVSDLSKEGYAPQAIASAVALMMGVYGIILGFLKLGFLLDFISVPILSGFISAAAITIMLGQVGSLIGEQNVGDDTATTIRNIFTQLPTASGPAAAVGFGGIVILTALQWLGGKYGNRNKVIWFLSITRAFVVLVIFTGISYAVNHKIEHSDNFVFQVSQVKANGIIPPKIPDSALVSKVVGRSVAAFIAAAVEHTSIARAFGAKNNYVTDQSQELCYLGIINFFNSFFSAMGVGGAMSRTAVNSQCGVRSPLSGLLTSGFVLVAIYKLTGALFWIPKATLAAIIITAVWPLIGSPMTYYKYWRTSLADFIAAMISFWVSLFVTTEVGIGSAVAFSIVYYLLKQVFTCTTQIGADSLSELAQSLDAARGMPIHVPSDTRVFRFNENLFFPNANRVKNTIFDAVQTYHSGAYSNANGSEADRNWSVVGEKRVAALRKKANVQGNPPLIRVCVLDFSKVNHLDTTALSALRSFFSEMKKYASETVEIRFVAVSDSARLRFERGGWELVDAERSSDVVGSNSVRVFKSVADAVSAPRHEEIFDVMVKGDEKSP